ncbi:MAG: hypothetical protein K2J78_00570 [Muribaculaceae bacterium]|nr:hypothetical protein [Muribaculaceae bacterium]
MKISLYQTFRLLILLTCVVLTVIGCSHKKYDETLNQADVVLDMFPDSALSILETIDPASINDKEEKARHALLLSLATLKVDYTSDESVKRADSIFRPAFEYYKDKTHPSRENMLAHYTEAYLQDSALISLKEYDRAIELAKQLGDWNYQALSYLNKALLYNHAFSSDDELQCIAEAQKISPHITIPYIKIYIAESAGDAYRGIVDTENAEKYYKEMLTLAKEAKDSAYIFQAHKHLASIYSVQGRYKESMELLQPLIADSTFVETLQPNEIIDYSETLLMSDHKDEAMHLINLLRDYRDKYEGLCYYNALSMLAAYEGDYKRVFGINDSLITYSDALVTEKLTFSLLHQEKEYDKKLADINRIAYHRKSIIILLSLVTFCLGLCILLLYHRLRLRNMEKSIFIKEEENRELITQLNELEHRADSLENELKANEEKIKSSEQQLVSIRKEKDDLYSEKEAIKNDLKSKAQNIDQLTKILETEKVAYSDLEKRLNNDLTEYRQKIATLKKEKSENLLAMTRTEAKLLNNWLNTPVQKNERKIEVFIEKYRDKSLLQTIEKTINDSTGGIIDFLNLNLKLKSEWIEQVILDICGFNYVSTGTILNITPSNASARKTRIKHKLLKTADEEKRKWLTEHIPMLQ